jgi:uncharacterized membrane protein
MARKVRFRRLRLSRRRSFSARLIVVLLRLALILTLAVLVFYVWKKSHHHIMDTLMP